MAHTGKRAVSAGKAARDNAYIQKLIEDEDLRDSLRTAFESSKKAYGRMSNGKGPSAALLDDKKVQKELKEAATSLREAADTFRGVRKKRRKGRLLFVVLIGAGVAMVASEGVRNKVLDALFGAEEEFEYTSTTSSGDGAASSAPAAQAGASSS